MSKCNLCGQQVPDETWKDWEYLDYEGNWVCTKEIFNNYRKDLRKLNYNFGWKIDYYIGKTPQGFEVIWRTKNGN